MTATALRQLARTGVLLLLIGFASACAVPAVQSAAPAASPSIPGASVSHRATSEGKDTSKQGSDPGGLWAATVLSPSDEMDGIDNPLLLRRFQRNWTRAIESDFPPDGDITCDPLTFIPLREVYLINIAVIGPDSEVAMSALLRAESRMMRVTPEGRELTADELDQSWKNGEEVNTISYVSEPEKSGLLVGISNIDTQGERYPWMFRTFLRILAEELRRDQAVPAKIVPFLTPDTLAWLKEQRETLPSTAELH